MASLLALGAASAVILWVAGGDVDRALHAVWVAGKFVWHGA